MTEAERKIIELLEKILAELDAANRQLHNIESNQ